MTRLLKDPLAHFLAAGLVIFIIGNALSPPEREEKRIVVNRAALLEFIQYRSKAFEPAAAESLLDSIQGEARKKLIRDYVEEEALYREAKALGLEGDDYVIKQRLIQKLGFVADAASKAEPTEQEIADYFAAHEADYVIPPSVTFAHVFFTNERRGAEAAKALAAEEARKLRESAALFEDAAGKGERFPFHTNYVERTYDYVESQFGEEAAREIFSEKAPFNEWRGPIVSPYGAHAIFVKKVEPARHQTIFELRERVAEDTARSKAADARSELIAGLIAKYAVINELDAPAKARGLK
jgi:hypothetical protein